jgi:hypothetical protein
MDAQSTISTLTDWATQNGAHLHSSVQVYNDLNTGLSFRVDPAAPAPVEAHEPIVRLPAFLALSYINALSDKDTSALTPELVDQLRPHVIARLFLIKEFLRGKDSFWWPYIQALPQPSDRAGWALPPFWDDDEAELLEGTNVEVGLEKIRRDVKRELSEVNDILSSLNNDFASKFTPELYQWAYCIYSSRSFRPSLVLSDAQQKSLPDGIGVDDFSVLLPLFDIGNHDMTTPIAWELCTETATCDLKVAKSFQPGEQVYNNYSMKTNAELLLGYGFMITPSAALHNDYTHVRKRSSDPDASEEYLISYRPFGDSSSLLARARLSPRLLEQAESVTPAFRHVSPEMVWDIFCTLAPEPMREVLLPIKTTDGAANGSTAADDDCRQRLVLSGQVTGEPLAYFAQTAAIIQHKVMQELDRLNETDVEVAEGDEKLLSANQKLAFEYRERCRRVLESTLEAMNEDETLAAAMEVGDDEE